MLYNILDYGAIADGKTLATLAIQKAIDDCNKHGGGTVIIPSGNFYTGSIFLRDNVELHFDIGAVLTASKSIEDYNADDAYPQNFGSEAEEWLPKHLIMAIECNNVAITGHGTINGSGDSFFRETTPTLPTNYIWMDGVKHAKDRKPGPLVVFVECTNVLVDGITIRNAPCWSILLHACEYVRVSNYQCFNPHTALQTDGLDIDCCRFVTVTNCNIQTGDDGITFRCDTWRQNKRKACEYVTVTNCNISVSSSAFRVGVGVGAIRHIRVSNITIERCGVGISQMGNYSGYCASNIEDVNFSDVSINFCSFPIEISGERGFVKNVTINNLRANHCIASLRIDPIKECTVSNINLRNVELYIRREERELTPARIAKRGENVIHVENATNITLENVSLYIDDDVKEFWKKGFYADNPSEVHLLNCNF